MCIANADAIAHLDGPMRRSSSCRAGAAGVLLCGASALMGCRSSTPDIPTTVPDFSRATFANPTRVDNPYFPLVAGTTTTFEGDTADGAERIVIDVLAETHVIAGVECVVVRDRAYVNEVLVEDTRDWYAQDDDGNVWYMGEDVDNYQYDAQGNETGVTHEGSWEAGADVAGMGAIARPGFLMKAAPVSGDTYSQEYYRGVAEDEAEIEALDVTVTLTDGTTYTCLRTRDFSPLEPTVTEYKYYAPGIGLVVEEDSGHQERLERVAP